MVCGICGLPVQVHSAPFPCTEGALAHRIAQRCPENTERTVALCHLLDAQAALERAESSNRVGKKISRG